MGIGLKRYFTKPLQQFTKTRPSRKIGPKSKRIDKKPEVSSKNKYNLPILERPPQSFDQNVGLIDSFKIASQVVGNYVLAAEEIINGDMASLLRQSR